MNQAEIIAMAKEAGLLPDNSHPAPETRAMRKRCEVVKRFAALVAAKEREAILKLIEELDEPSYIGYENPNTWDDALIALSALVRARGTKEGV